MRFSSPHDLTDTRACRPIIPHPRRRCRPRPWPPARRGRLPWPAGAAGDAARPRDRRGRRHTLASVLAVSAAAVVAGARSVTALAEWATDAPWPVLAALGVRCDPLTRRCQVPGEATIRRVLARVDGDAVDATVGAWLADRLRPLRHRRVIAVDGKTLRGSAHQGHQVHLLAALDHHDGAVLAQREVPTATNDIAEFQPLLDGLDLAGAVLTADALHPNATTPASWSTAAPRTCWSSRPTSRPCTPSWPGCRGGRSRSWTAPATMATAASRSGP
jgi:hypothetical protein